MIKTYRDSVESPRYAYTYSSKTLQNLFCKMCSFYEYVKLLTHINGADWMSIITNSFNYTLI